ncbi:xanthine dehydrogenase family protein molybdopterin-binding subunit [Amorphoplanes nipponensis]|uniref:Xanthine dehydrogenase n=1 Tax=Actinoplanes nipponensis TaxID=135950 RepID=A0A919MNL6_9ACTN|nr:molybdopterin-dependent oxidoreductase [Actinoplanes nipponensis]GIE51711.1 xanthine dehydrogenase [Actinoplanes nipponensis]
MPEHIDVKMTVNGQPRSATTTARTTLADFLRESCGLTATHVGCEQGVCGACTVSMDGVTVLSCLLLAVQADGAEIRTAEGLGGPDGALSPLAAALQAEHGIQCGFCTPGFLMRGTELLRERPAPAEAEIRAGLCGNLCRCTGYTNVIKAVARAAEAGGTAPSPAEQAALRREDLRLLAGRGEFVNDVSPPGTLHAAFLRSIVASGRILRLDASAARSLDGVVAVLTAADLNDRAGPMQPTPRLADDDPRLLPLAGERVHFAGEPLALVVARDRYVAEDALELIEVEIEPARPVLEPETAAEDTTNLVYPETGTNLCTEMASPVRPKLRRALDDSPHVVRATCRQQRQANAPMETRGVVASYDPGTGELSATISTQNPHEAKLAMSRVTGLAAERIRVTARDVGGSFGQKFWTGRDELTVTLAAYVLGRTIKWIEDGRENFTASTHARGDVGTGTFALDEDGRFLGSYLDHLEDTGAYPTGVIAKAGPFVGMMFTGPYRIPQHAFRFRSVRTSTCPRGAYRGPWAFATVAREEMLDEVARAVGLDPLELRRRNVLSAAELPYSLPTRLMLDHVTPADTLEEVARLLDYDRLRERQRRLFEQEGRLLGLGLALCVEPSSIGTMDPISTDTARLRVEPDGTVTAFLATGSGGQGVETTMAQVVAGELGLAVDAVRVVQGDTGDTPYGRGTGASGTAVITGSACRAAAGELLTTARQLAAGLLGVPAERIEPRDGALADRLDPAAAATWAELAQAARTAGDTGVLEAVGRFKAPPVTWSNACHGCLVEVDRELGLVRIERYVVAEDCGRIINTKVVEGQVAGGVLQGIGGALFEEVRYDEQGRPLTLGLADYTVPTAVEAPAVECAHIETPSPTPGGHKGMGQGGAVGALPCVFNAVADALALVGARVDRTPVDPERILTALARADAERLQPAARPASPS